MCALGSSPVISHLCHLPAVGLTYSHQASSLLYKSLVVISPSHVYCEYEEWPCLCCPGMLASTEWALHTWDRPQRSTLQLLSCVPKCGIFHRASCWPCWPFGSVTTGHLLIAGSSGDQPQAGQAEPTRKLKFDSALETCQSRDRSPWCLLRKLPNMLSEQEWLPPSPEPDSGARGKSEASEMPWKPVRMLTVGGVPLKVIH